MTYKECRNILFDCHEEEKFTRDWCENIIIESGANKGKGIPERTWKALFNNKILKDNKDNTFSFIEKGEKDGERQKHGFDFQVYAQKLFGLTKTSQTKKYTAKWDAYYNDSPVSVKTEQIGTDIEMASFRRNASNLDNFYLIVGFWEGQEDNIVKIETLYVNGEEYHQLFNQELVKKCLTFVKNISNDRKDDEKWKKGIEALKKEWQENTPNLVRPRFKRDHSKQKRMQCSINYSDFYSYFMPRYQTTELKIIG